jgi:hypothetical protein
MSLEDELRRLEQTDPKVKAAAESYDRMVEKVLTTFPYHYRDNGEVCSWSHTKRMSDDEPCPNGCSGAQHHYANDGHEECATE